MHCICSVWRHVNNIYAVDTQHIAGYSGVCALYSDVGAPYSSMKQRIRSVWQHVNAVCTSYTQHIAGYSAVNAMYIEVYTVCRSVQLRIRRVLRRGALCTTYMQRMAMYTVRRAYALLYGWYYGVYAACIFTKKSTAQRLFENLNFKNKI